jgi:hypothetical protein
VVCTGSRGQRVELGGVVGAEQVEVGVVDAELAQRRYGS